MHIRSRRNEAVAFEAMGLEVAPMAARHLTSRRARNRFTCSQYRNLIVNSSFCPSYAKAASENDGALNGALASLENP